METTSDTPKKFEEMSSEELEKKIAEDLDRPAEPEVKVEEKKEAEAQSEGQGEEKVEDASPDKEEENLILGKFKSNEDLLKAYPELEKKLGEQGQEIGSLRKQDEVRRSQLSQFFDLDSEGNVVGVKPAQAPPPTASQEEQLAKLRPIFPDWSDQMIMNNIGVMGALFDQGLKNFEAKIQKELEPLREVRFEREVEKQIKIVKGKYKELWEANEDIVRTRLDSLPPEIRAKKGAAETILLTTLGEKAPELRAKIKEMELAREAEVKKETVFVEGSGKSAVPTPQVDVGKLSSDEIAKLINSAQRK